VNGEDNVPIPKDKFVLIRKWIDAEAQINSSLEGFGVDFELCADSSLLRLQSVLKRVQYHSEKIESREDVLKFVETVLELEPKATTQYLLLNSGGGKLPLILDMVLGQGLMCIEDKSLLFLLTFCEHLLDQMLLLGRERPRSMSPFKELGKDLGNSSLAFDSTRLQSLTELAAHAAATSIKRKPNRPMLRRVQTIGDLGGLGGRNSSALSPVQSRPHTPTTTSPKELPLLPSARSSTPTSRPTSAKESTSPKLPSLTNSPILSPKGDRSELPKSKFALYLDACEPSEEKGSIKEKALPTASDAKDEKTEEGDKPAEKKVVRRRRKSITASTTSLTDSRRPSLKDAAEEVVHRQSLSRSSSLTKKKSIDGASTQCLSARARNSGSQNFSASGEVDKAGKTLNRARSSSRSMQRRRNSIGTGSEASMALQAASSEMSDLEWELISCQIFWSSMPPQTITFAIGAGLHSVGSRKLRSKIIRAAWLLLDKAKAVECIVGVIGTTRLRLEMDMLLDQFNRSIHFGKDTDAEELEPFLDKVRLTMVHLQTICEADTKLAQVAVLYGVAFIAECICTWAESTAGGVKLASSTRTLLRIINPYLCQLFQRRLDTDEDLS